MSHQGRCRVTLTKRKKARRVLDDGGFLVADRARRFAFHRDCGVNRQAGENTARDPEDLAMLAGVDALPEFLEHFRVELRDVVGLAAGHEALVNYDRFVAPVRACVDEICLD